MFFCKRGGGTTEVLPQGGFFQAPRMISNQSWRPSATKTSPLYAAPCGYTTTTTDILYAPYQFDNQLHIKGRDAQRVHQVILFPIVIIKLTGSSCRGDRTPPQIEVWNHFRRDPFSNAGRSLVPPQPRSFWNKVNPGQLIRRQVFYGPDFRFDVRLSSSHCSEPRFALSPEWWLGDTGAMVLAGLPSPGPPAPVETTVQVSTHLSSSLGPVLPFFAKPPPWQNLITFDLELCPKRCLPRRLRREIELEASVYVLYISPSHLTSRTLTYPCRQWISRFHTIFWCTPLSSR